MKMRNRIAALLLCLSMGAALVACGESKTADAASATQSSNPAKTADSSSNVQRSTTEITTDGESNVEQSITEITNDGASSTQQSASELEIADMVNPWTDVETQEEAQQQAGFTMLLPASLPDEYGTLRFRVIPGDILEADYAGNGDANLCIRKAAGTEDPSGDYNRYAHSQQVKTGDVTVTMKGNDGAVSLAVWRDDNYAYSIGIYNASGIPAEEMIQMVSEMLCK